MLDDTGPHAWGLGCSQGPSGPLQLLAGPRTHISLCEEMGAPDQLGNLLGQAGNGWEGAKEGQGVSSSLYALCQTCIFQYLFLSLVFSH